MSRSEYQTIKTKLEDLLFISLYYPYKEFRKRVSRLFIVYTYNLRIGNI